MKRLLGAFQPSTIKNPLKLIAALLAGLNNGTGVGPVEAYDLGAPTARSLP